MYRFRLAVAAAVASPLIGGSQAVAASVGNAGQSQSMTQTTDQGSTQQQATGSGDLTVGSPSQTNDQGAATNQAINQTQTGTFVVFGNGGPIQKADETAETNQQNNQSLSGYFIVGDPKQANRQRSKINQNIDQTLDGTFVVLGNTIRPDPTTLESIRGLNRCGLCTEAMVGSSSRLVGGNLTQTGKDSEDYGTFVVFGNLTQSFVMSDTVTEINNQSLGGTGNVIVGSPSEQNDQGASIDQNIRQNLTGIFVVFGFLQQSASETAKVKQINNQN